MMNADNHVPTLRILDTPAHMQAVEELQLAVWGVVEAPTPLLITFAHNGGLVIGAFDERRMIGFVAGFPGLIVTPDEIRVKHCSHVLGVLPEFRNRGVGYALKRAQWQMVRRQGVELITWTYDPLLSRNAHLNIARLGAVSRKYVPEMYGNMHDDLNRGLPSDRLQVELWVNSPRVQNRMSKHPRRQLDLAHYLSTGAEILNPTRLGEAGYPQPGPAPAEVDAPLPALALLEIPSDFHALKAADRDLALAWRLHVRALLQDLFARGYLITDFIHLKGDSPRSFYVLSHGDRTLGE